MSNLGIRDMREVTITTLSALFDDGSCIEIEGIDEIPSAQQCVFVVRIQITRNRHISHVTNKKTETIMPSLKIFQNRSDNPLMRALKDGNGRLVVRIWKGGASWWNLNSNCDQTCTKVAKAEVAGYRVARRALTMYAQHCRKRGNSKRVEERWNSTEVTIPELLYFSLDDERKDTEKISTSVTSFPLAIFSYVGAGSNTIIATNNNQKCDSNKNSIKWAFCDSFVRNMVKERNEFGYNEAHPRHGRVSVGLALQYAMQVLDSVILPIHSAFFLGHLYGSTPKKDHSQSNKFTDGLGDGKINALLLEDIYPLSRVRNIGNLDGSEVITEPTPYRYHDMIILYQKILLSLRCATPTESRHANMACNRNQHLLIHILKECVENLISEANLCYPNLTSGYRANSKDVVPPVLCHMDLQPQNMIMRQPLTYFTTASSTPHIASVLDWEESCLADPRFELLMLCRKVVANRVQADILWEHYSNIMEKRFELPNNIFGPIEPWLKLETVHSLITLIMQGMDLQGGGRNPWEGKNDIWEKVSRELSRLVDLGWYFCQIDTVDAHPVE